MPTASGEIKPFTDKVGALCAAGDYRGMSELFASFVKEHPGTTYLAFEPLPAKIAAHITEAVGSSAFTTFTLKRPTWTSEIAKVAAEPEAFAALVHRIEAEAASYTGGKG